MGGTFKTDTDTNNAPLSLMQIARALTYLVYAWVIVSLVILTFGFFLLLFGANPDAAFAAWVYRGLERVMAPFRGIFEAVRLDGRSVLDVSVLFAMIVYGIVAMVLHGVIGWLTERVAELELKRRV
jgi:uncharacterized protein YggT (Ycf19 family)